MNALYNELDPPEPQGEHMAYNSRTDKWGRYEDEIKRCDVCGSSEHEYDETDTLSSADNARICYGCLHYLPIEVIYKDCLKAFKLSEHANPVQCYQLAQELYFKHNQQP